MTPYFRFALAVAFAIVLGLAMSNAFACAGPGEESSDPDWPILCTNTEV